MKQKNKNSQDYAQLRYRKGKKANKQHKVNTTIRKIKLNQQNRTKFDIHKYKTQKKILKEEQ